MINTLQVITEILHEDMLKTLNLYCFYNYASDKKNLLNSYSKKPQINQ